MAKLAVRGQYLAPVTPFSREGALMLDAFAEIIRWHIDCGVDGFLIAGDNGEAWALKPTELGRVVETAVNVVAGRVPVFAGASAITAAETITLAEIAADAGADGLCVTPQAYVLGGTKAEVAGRYAALAKAVPLQIMVYNNPARTGVNVTADILGAICDVAPVVGLKEASGDFVHVSGIIEKFADRIGVLAGAAHFIIPALALGAAGYLSTAPELFGARARRILEFESMPMEERRDLHVRITKIFEVLMWTGTRPAAYKAAINMIGLPAGYPREPVQPLTREDEAKVRAVLAECGVFADSVPQRAAS